VHKITPPPQLPDLSKYKTETARLKADERYQKRVEDWNKDRDAFAEMQQTLGLTHDQAQQMLVQHYWKPTDTGTIPEEVQNSNRKRPYDERGRALAALYGEDFLEWRAKFKKEVRPALRAKWEQEHQ